MVYTVYYDPLLCYLQNLNTGYEVKANKILNVYESEFEQQSISIPCMAYMNDTNIISNKLEDLEKMLISVNEFNLINDIQINKEKSELLLRLNNKDNIKKLKISFGNQEVEISPIPHNQSLLILGVWFNAYNKNDFVYNQIKNEIFYFSNLMKKKKITDKCIYLIL
jgi:hypothetical protein